MRPSYLSEWIFLFLTVAIGMMMLRTAHSGVPNNAPVTPGSSGGVVTPGNSSYGEYTESGANAISTPRDRQTATMEAIPGSAEEADAMSSSQASGMRPIPSPTTLHRSNKSPAKPRLMQEPPL